MAVFRGYIVFSSPEKSLRVGRFLAELIPRTSFCDVPPFCLEVQEGFHVLNKIAISLQQKAAFLPSEKLIIGVF
jgi:hypothetical protein